MATYAIGDIQGCYQTLQKLLNQIHFNPSSDTLWLAGDLINRGKDSLKTLQFVYQHRAQIRCVLGNHDLHFLAIQAQKHQPTKKDTLDELLLADECDELADWLLQQPLFHYDAHLNFAMAHAGVLPEWNVQDAQRFSAEVSNCLQSPARREFFEQMYGNQPEQWNANLSDMTRLRFITNSFTRMRYCYVDGALELSCKVPPGQQPSGLYPWFELPENKLDCNLVFGHWASLEGKCSPANYYALDTGCVWGGQLSALRLEDQQLFQCASIE